MDMDAIIGTALIAGALAALSCLVLWSRRTIERIARKRSRSARAILKDLNGEQ